MLTDILYASIDTKPKVSNRYPTTSHLSMSSLFPCPYRMYRMHKGETNGGERTPRELLQMEDGWDQEEQTVKRLARAGIKIEWRDPRVTLVVGRTKTFGTPDGLINLGPKARMWEHKAWNGDAYSDFLSSGLKNRIQEKCQVNAYILGAREFSGQDIDECIFMVKHKDSNSYHDIIVPFEPDFILPIIEWADRIREGWIPKPEERSECSHCGFGCFGSVNLDMSKIGSVSQEEMVDKWRKSKVFKAIGLSMEEESRAYFVGVQNKITGDFEGGIIGDRDVLFAGDLEIKRIEDREFHVDKYKILEEFGIEGLLKVGEEIKSFYYRFRDRR